MIKTKYKPNTKILILKTDKTKYKLSLNVKIYYNVGMV